MKIAVLTMIFNNNYGGYLQAYALMEILKKLNHEPELIFVQQESNTLKYKLKKYLKKYVLSYFLPKYNYEKYRSIIEKNTNYFSDKYIVPRTERVYSQDDFIKYSIGYDAYIAGSDQIWRPTMYKYINQAFFGFVQDKNALLLSYAASFGLDIWEYTEQQTQRFKNDIQRFKAISVRENSGIELCKKHFETDAEHVLDPTMLLTQEDYKNLFINENEPKSIGDLLTYILDETEEKMYLIELVSQKMNLNRFAVNVKTKDPNRKLEDRIYPTVTSWIRGFYDAKFIITDSFHGCVFAIIFNKPFIVCGNKRRGMARFNSLLNMFGLNERLVLSKEDISLVSIQKEINWDNVNDILNTYRNKSIDFLNRNLV